MIRVWLVDKDGKKSKSKLEHCAAYLYHVDFKKYVKSLVEIPESGFSRESLDKWINFLKECSLIKNEFERYPKLYQVSFQESFWQSISTAQIKKRGFKRGLVPFCGLQRQSLCRGF